MVDSPGLIVSLSGSLSYPRGVHNIGLDHHVGHLVSITTADNQRLDSVKGCTRRVPSPSLTRPFSHDSGLRRRELWDRSSKRRNVAVITAPNAGIGSNVRSCVRSTATCKPKGSHSVKRPRCLRCPAVPCRRGAHTKTVLMPVLRS